MKAGRRSEGAAMAKHVGELLKTARVAAGLSLRALEKKTGIAASIISQIETGKTKDPGVTRVQKLCLAIGISLDDLFGLRPTRQALLTEKAVKELEQTKAEMQKIMRKLDQLLHYIGRQTSFLK